MLGRREFLKLLGFVAPAAALGELVVPALIAEPPRAASTGELDRALDEFWATTILDIDLFDELHRDAISRMMAEKVTLDIDAALLATLPHHG